MKNLVRFHKLEDLREKILEILGMSSSRCAACKHLRKRCPKDCIFSPYFPPNNRERFEQVHKIYGASNIGKMLQDLPEYLRAEAANSLCYEASCRQRDPVYGSVGVISVLQQQIYNSQCQLAQIQSEIAVANAQYAQTHHQQNYIQNQGVDGNLYIDQTGGTYDHKPWLY